MWKCAMKKSVVVSSMENMQYNFKLRWKNITFILLIIMVNVWVKDIVSTWLIDISLLCRFTSSFP
jgi:hypothetical protein